MRDEQSPTDKYLYFKQHPPRRLIIAFFLTEDEITIGSLELEFSELFCLFLPDLSFAFMKTAPSYFIFHYSKLS